MKITRKNGGSKYVIEGDVEELSALWIACRQALTPIYGVGKSKYALSDRQRIGLSIISMALPKELSSGV